MSRPGRHPQGRPGNGGHRLQSPAARYRREDPAASSGPRPGWYAYQVGSSAGLPPWAVEIALTIERPATPAPEGPRSHVEPDWWQSGALQAPTQVLVLLRAPSRARFLGPIARAAAEVEAAMGLRPMAGRRAMGSPGLLMGSALPGLTPVPPVLALAHLGGAGARGLPAPVRRRQPSMGWEATWWRWSAGSVLTCDGPSGRSAQAVIALRGLGSIGAISPPSGGALVLRAWRVGSRWGLACGLVLGAPAALGLGREAGRVAAKVREQGWDAAVLCGPSALHLAWAGNPGNEAPAASAHAASAARVTALVEACLAAGGVDHPAASSQWVLPVTP